MLILEINKHSYYQCDNCNLPISETYVLLADDRELAFCLKCFKALPGFVETQLKLLGIR